MHSTIITYTFAVWMGEKHSLILIILPFQLGKMNIDNLKSQMRKGMLEFCVLLLLKRGDAYASEMIASLKAAHLIVMEGTLYPLLTRLKNDGLLAYRWEESTQGPPRKYYSITPDGLIFLEQLQESWNEISHSVQLLTDDTQVCEIIITNSIPNQEEN